MSMPTPQFGSVLADLLFDFETATALAAAPEDAVARLSQGALHSLTADFGGPLPRLGLHAYADGAALTPKPVRLQLDVKF